MALLVGGVDKETLIRSFIIDTYYAIIVVSTGGDVYWHVHHNLYISIIIYKHSMQWRTNDGISYCKTTEETIDENMIRQVRVYDIVKILVTTFHLNQRFNITAREE